MDQAAEAGFDAEFGQFMRARRELRRFVPTPDSFPKFCELIDAAKAFYAGLPAVVRSNLKYIPFEYFGRQWFIRMNPEVLAASSRVYINLCSGDTKSVMATVVVTLSESLQEIPK